MNESSAEMLQQFFKTTHRMLLIQCNTLTVWNYSPENGLSERWQNTIEMQSAKGKVGAEQEVKIEKMMIH